MLGDRRDHSDAPERLQPPQHRLPNDGDSVARVRAAPGDDENVPRSLDLPLTQPTVGAFGGVVRRRMMRVKIEDAVPAESSLVQRATNADTGSLRHRA